MKNESFTSRLRAWLKNIPVEDPVDRHMVSLLQVILMGFMAMFVIAAGINWVIAKEIPWHVNLMRSAIAILILGIPMVLLRLGYLRISVLIVLAILLLVETYAVTAANLRDVADTLSFFTLATILAGLLVSRLALVFTLVWSAGAVVVSAIQGWSAGRGEDGFVIAANFILLNGLMSLFLDRFGLTLRNALSSALAREKALQTEIIERKRVNEALRESEERYSKLIDQARDVIFTISATGRITSLNPAFEIFTGWSREAWIGRPFDDLVAENEHGRARDQFNRILRGETLRALRLRMYTRSGDILVVEMNISPQFKDDQVIGLLGIARDMTQEQRAEDALRASEMRFRALIENGWDAFTLADSQGTILYASPSTIRVLGYTPEEFVGVNAFTLFHPEDMALARNKLMEVLQMPGKVVIAQARTRHADGSWRWMEGVVTNLLDEPSVQALVTNYRDITERKLAEENLHASEERFYKVFEDNPAAMIISNPTGEIILVNEQAHRTLGYDAGELVGMNIEQLLPENLRGPHMHHRVVYNQHPSVRQMMGRELKARRKDGTEFPVEVGLSPLKMSDGTFILASIVDVTERKRAESKLQQQNQRLKALREIDTAILAADSVENIVGAALDHIRELIDCERANLALIEWEKNEAVNFDVRDTKESAISKGARVSLDLIEDILHVLSRNQPVIIDDLTTLPDPSPQIKIFIKEGLRSRCILPLISQGNLIGSFTLSSEIPGYFDEDKINLGREVANQVAIAITQSNLLRELRELNAKLEQRVIEREGLIVELTNKNAELERFTYTVSHDLKSPLVTMKGFLGYLEQDAVTGNIERLKGDTQRIANAADKMSQLLDDLLELSRIGRFVNPSEIIPFEELARQAIELMDGPIQEHNIKIELQDNLPDVFGDKSRLIEVLQNLIENAIKYIGDQPEPRIEIGRCGEEDGKPIFYVKDNGIGIVPEYQERIFGLFNKLDAASEGTGIGLALVRRIIEFHGGRIWVESKVGKGSAFCFTLGEVPEATR